MNTRTILRVAVLGSSVVLALAAVHLGFPTDSKALQNFDFASQLNGRISVKGRVVEQDNTPISDVKMRVRESTFTNSLNPDDSKTDENTEHVIDGDFEVSCDSCFGFDVTFLKKGHFTERFMWNVAHQEGSEEKVLILDDVVVVLGKKPIPVQMAPLNGDLRLDQQGPKMVIALGGKMPGTAVLGPQKTLETLQAPYVQLSAEKANDGEFATREMPIPNRDGVTRSSPLGLKLRFSEPEDGLAFYDPKAPCMDTVHVFREMREAPETGYQNVVELDDAAPGCDQIYFYCRIGGLFGKGRLPRPGFVSRHHMNEVGTALYIRLNPDGSRNVTTWN